MPVLVLGAGDTERERDRPSSRSHWGFLFSERREDKGPINKQLEIIPESGLSVINQASF